VAASNTVLDYFCDQISGNQNGGTLNNGQATVDKMFAISQQQVGYTDFTFYFKKISDESYPGTIKKVRAKINVWINSVTPSNSIYLKLYGCSSFRGF